LAEAVKKCGFCDIEGTEAVELIGGEIWVYCLCGHITKYFPDGHRELWVGEADSIVISKVRDL